MHNKPVQVITKKGKSASPAGKGSVCLFILEPLEDCPSRGTSYEEMCPFSLEPCSSAEN
jgi:hypothetical protein